MVILAFIAGYLLAAIPAGFAIYLLRDDNHKLINEFSIRTNGRTVFRPEKQAIAQLEKAGKELGERFGLLTPSMAEEEAELNDDDLDHLRNEGIVS